jgi:hypothetical protein
MMRRKVLVDIGVYVTYLLCLLDEMDVTLVYGVEIYAHADSVHEATSSQRIYISMVYP